MSSNLIRNPSFERATIDPWQTTAGDITQVEDPFAIEGTQVALISPVEPPSTGA